MTAIAPPPEPAPAPDEDAGDLAWRRTHPATAILTAVRSAPRVVLLLIPLFLRFRMWGLLVAGVALLVFRALAWYTTTYRLGRSEIVVRRGILNRSERTVPANRVQSVDSRRRVLHQALGLTAIEIALAGSKPDRIELDAITEIEAERIRRRLHPVLTDAGASVAGPPPERLLLALTPRLIAVGALSGAGLLTVPILLAGALNYLDDLRPVAGALDRLRSIGWVAPTIVVVILSPLVAVAVSLLRNHGFTLSESAGQLRVRRGLTEARVSVIAVPRVVTLTRSQNRLRRWLGLAALDIRTAAATRRGGEEGVGTGDDSVPVAKLADIETLERILAPEAEALQHVHLHPIAARRRAMIRASAIPLLVALGLAFRSPILAGIVALGGIGLASGWARLAHRARTYADSPDVIVSTWGWFFGQRRIVLLGKVESVRITQSPMQRRAALATLHLDLPVGNAHLPDLAAAEAARLAKRFS